jgi:hypothetical protein
MGGHRQQSPGQVLAWLLRGQVPQLALEVTQRGRLSPALRARREMGMRAVKLATGQLTVDEGGELVFQMAHGLAARLPRSSLARIWYAPRRRHRGPLAVREVGPQLGTTTMDPAAHGPELHAERGRDLFV